MTVGVYTVGPRHERFHLGSISFNLINSHSETFSNSLLEPLGEFSVIILTRFIGFCL